MKESKEITQKVQEAKENYIDENVKKITKEAVDSITLIKNVIELLDKKEKDKAIEEVAKAVGKIEILIVKDPSLQLVPIDVKENIIEFPSKLEDIETIKSKVILLIKSNEVQKARDIMLNLASELDIYITALPIGTYPVALKAIVPLIKQEKFEEAKKLLIEVINTLVVEKIVIPLPLLRAEQTIIKANELANKEESKKEELEELLAYAKSQLKLAEALGYGKIEVDYKDLYREIEKLEKVFKKNGSTKDIFSTLKEKLSLIMIKFNKPKEPTKMPTKEDKSS